MKRTALLCCAALWAAGVSPAATAAEPTTWVVDDDKIQCPVAHFTSIQAAVSDGQVNNGDTVEVCPGTYKESVVVTKEITVHGVGDPVKNLDCFNDITDAEFAALVDPTKFAILQPPQTDTPVKDSLLSLQVSNITLSGLVVQGQIQGEPTKVDNPERQPGGKVDVYEAAIETTSVHSGYRISDNVIWNNTVGIEFGSAGVSVGSISTVQDNCFRASFAAVANQRLALNNAVIADNKSFRNTGPANNGVAYELGFVLGRATNVEVRDNTSEADANFVLLENTENVLIDSNDIIGAGTRGIVVRAANAKLKVTDNAVSNVGAGVSFLGAAQVAAAKVTLGAIIEGNTLTGNVIGIAFQTGTGAVGTVIRDNDASGNTQAGIRLRSGTTGNVIENNTVNDNHPPKEPGVDPTTGVGILMESGAAGNTITGNSMSGNGLWDAQDQTPPQNTWTNNICGKSLPREICAPAP
ncbi:right-handed parallel beta-helix repeat-containing protein [Arthrobacter sp. SLBN-100]|uniref:right-handed parallel beta-helix repeat-containing protein n=1 Tax=Arthrobacter sp. SLBN-100 TaxID=2768450 RepID=UPI00135789EF|nr:NosD domain-containing protein [Arthrobacter sp. SLBN-100]